MYHQQFPIIISRSERAQQRLRRKLFLAAKPLQLRYAVTEKHLSFDEKDQLDYQTAPEGGGGFVWGHSGQLVWRSAWFCAQAELSAELAQWKELAEHRATEYETQEPITQIALDLSFSGEGLVFCEDGQIVQGISGGSVLKSGFERSLVMDAESLIQNGHLKIWIEATANTLFGLDRDSNPLDAAKTADKTQCPHYYGEHQGKVHSAQVVLFDKALWHYLLALESATELAQGLLGSRAAGTWGAGGSAGKVAPPRAKRLIHAIDRALNLSGVGKVFQAHRLLREALVNGNSPSDLETVAVGHAHIDTGWLWPVSETVRKCARTFANQLRLIEHYPDYVFGASQAQHYAFVKQCYPELYQKVAQQVREGRWEVQGAMWVEADANIPSGESFVRQILHGKNFFMDEFGVDVKNLWLPDVFGYSANLPQILKRAGVDYFLTQKLSWSQYNDFPHHSFHWHGIDGSSVLTHFPPESTYNSTLTLGGRHGIGLGKAQNAFKEAHILDEFMTLYGVGDGGGGPDEEMIERGRVLAEGVEAAPRLKFGRVDQFFERLAQKAEKLPHWAGELYLELHRGTFTTQAKTKRGNRQLEQALCQTEYLYSLSYGQGIAYPQTQLDAIWKTLLINQFHDIIPGSSIHEVYQRTEAELEDGLDQCRQMQQAWGKAHLGQPAGESSGKDCEALLLINPYSWPLQLVLPLPEGWKGAQTAKDAPNITGFENGQCRVLSSNATEALLQLEPQGIAHLKVGPEQPLNTEKSVQGSENAGQFCLENHLVRYTFAANGRLLSGWDKECNRAIIAEEGSGNRLRLYEDWPRDWDAWEIDINYQDEMLEEPEAKEASLLTEQGLSQTLRFRYRFGAASTLEQTVRLEAQSKRLLFSCRADWHERHKMLRVSFALEAQSTKASYDIQYGYLERPTHRNTSWDMAQFEVVGQRYADISEFDYGITLLNDCKYGHQVLENVLDLNLLRSPTLPDPEADQGSHEFCYALLPHSGGLHEAMPLIQAEAAFLNGGIVQFPLKSVASSDFEPPLRLFSEDVSLEVLKKAEKSDALIVRLVERSGKRSKAKVLLQKGYCKLQECDLMEWNPIGHATEANEIELHFMPFAIRTFMLQTS